MTISTGNTPKALSGWTLPKQWTLKANKSLPKPKKPKSKEALDAYGGVKPQAFRV